MDRGGAAAASVVIPARNAAGTLPAVLEALARQQLPAGELEVIVADNGSTDATAHLAEAAGAHVVRVPRPNRGQARNEGARAASGERLLFLDADCVPQAGWARALLTALAADALAAGPIDAGTSSFPSAVERFELLWRFRQETYVREGGWAPTGNLAVRRAAFESLGGFDPGFRAGEDVDFCLRAADAGLTLGWAEGGRVTHPAERRVGGLAKRGLRHGFAATRHRRATAGRYGRRYWAHPGPLLRGAWALQRFGVDPASLPAGERRAMLRLGRLEYAARMAGSLIAEFPVSAR